MTIFVTLIIGGALAAAVMVETSTELNEEAEEVTVEVLMEISGSIRCVSSYAFRNSSTGEVDRIQLTIGPGLGSPPVSTQELVMEISDGMTVETYGFNQSEGLDITMLRDQDGSMTNGTMDQGDLARLTVHGSFGEGERVRFVFYLAPFGSSTFSVRIPDPLVYDVTRL